jgi:putative ATP-dependent DNA ligase
LDSGEILSKSLRIPYWKAKRLLYSKSIRRMTYKNITYYLFKRDIRGYPEGTSILYKKGFEPRLVPGYPPIKRILILEKAVPKHFIDDVVVEEKMNGYNVRLLEYGGEVLAVTRGGYICPYTTQRMRKSLTERAREILGEADIIVFGEVVGTKNPYTRYLYPEEPLFGFYGFDIMMDKEFLPVDRRKKMLDEMEIKKVRELARIKKQETKKLLTILDKIEEQNREGIVLKDPLYRVQPLKYTTSETNIGDIREGMKFFFDEGRTYIFPRVLREIFVAYERGTVYWNREKARKLGEALVIPSLDSVLKAEKTGMLAEEFTLDFDETNELEEFIEFMHKQGIVPIVKTVVKNGGKIEARILKPKKTFTVIQNILDTGLSPLD